MTDGKTETHKQVVNPKYGRRTTYFIHRFYPVKEFFFWNFKKIFHTYIKTAREIFFFSQLKAFCSIKRNHFVKKNTRPNMNQNNSNNYNIFTVSPQQNLTSANTLNMTSAGAVHPNTQTHQLTNILFHPTTFFYRPPNDFCHYYVNCKEICLDTVEYLINKHLKENNVQSNENEYIFYYRQQHDARFYQISCEIVSPRLIDDCLNKNFLGFELQNSEQEHLVFTINQKENLEYYLRQYLSFQLLN